MIFSRKKRSKSIGMSSSSSGKGEFGRDDIRSLSSSSALILRPKKAYLDWYEDFLDSASDEEKIYAFEGDVGVYIFPSSCNFASDESYLKYIDDLKIEVLRREFESVVRAQEKFPIDIEKARSEDLDKFFEVLIKGLLISSDSLIQRME